jgi:hypothetical protein
MNEHHFIAEAGLYGCLPNYCQFHDTYQAAVDDLAALHELGRDRKRILKRDGYLDLNIKRDGNEYAAVVACNCGNIEQHKEFSEWEASEV